MALGPNPKFKQLENSQRLMSLTSLWVLIVEMTTMGLMPRWYAPTNYDVIRYRHVDTLFDTNLHCCQS